MLPFIYICKKPIPMYLLMVIIGAIAMCCMSLQLTKKRKNIHSEDIIFMLLYAGIGCLIGAKLLYLIISVKTYWLWDKTFVENLKYWFMLLTSGGLVFYGGLIGAFIGAFRYCIHFKISIKESFEIIIPTIPLFHAFGRIGCFMAGCCYGIKYNGPLSVTFTHAIAAPNGISLFPIQVIEAMGNLIISIFLTILFYKEKRVNLCALYLMLYAIMRFLLEYLRGDTIRGKFLFLFTSQWISIAFFIIGVLLIIKRPCFQQNSL